MLQVGPGGVIHLPVADGKGETHAVNAWRNIARVTASCYGMNRKDQPIGRAPGYLEARELLKLS